MFKMKIAAALVALIALQWMLPIHAGILIGACFIWFWSNWAWATLTARQSMRQRQPIRQRLKGAEALIAAFGAWPAIAP